MWRRGAGVKRRRILRIARRNIARSVILPLLYGEGEKIILLAIQYFRRSMAPPASKPKCAGQGEPDRSYDTRDILDRAQQKRRSQRPRGLRLLIPGHRHYVPQEHAPQGEGRSKNKHAQYEQLAGGTKRHLFVSRRPQFSKALIVHFEGRCFDTDQSAVTAIRGSEAFADKERAVSCSFLSKPVRS